MFSNPLMIGWVENNKTNKLPTHTHTQNALIQANLLSMWAGQGEDWRNKSNQQSGNGFYLLCDSLKMWKFHSSALSPSPPPIPFKQKKKSCCKLLK